MRAVAVPFGRELQLVKTIGFSALTALLDFRSLEISAERRKIRKYEEGLYDADTTRRCGCGFAALWNLQVTCPALLRFVTRGTSDPQERDNRYPPLKMLRTPRAAT
jgi:hypothetical protein